MIKLIGLQYKFKYKRGIENQSRVGHFWQMQPESGVQPAFFFGILLLASKFSILGLHEICTK